MIRTSSKTIRISRVATIILFLSSAFYLYSHPYLYKTPPVIAFSIDYHGCLANERYEKQYIQLASSGSEDGEGMTTPLRGALLAYSNLKLASFMIRSAYQNSQATPLQKTPFILLNGSNRQFQIRSPYPPKSIEYFKDAPLPVALAVSEHFADYIQSLFSGMPVTVQVDPFLLGDIYGSHTPGYTWAESKQTVHTDENVLMPAKKVPKKQMDRDKFDIVYSQVHRVAHEYCKEDLIKRKQKLHFYFLDDNVKTLKNLGQFFRENPDLLPSNVSLFFINYTGDIMNQTSHVEGKGIIDQHYAHSIYYSYSHFEDQIQDQKLYKLQLLSNPQNLKDFKAYRLSAYNAHNRSIDSREAVESREIA